MTRYDNFFCQALIQFIDNIYLGESYAGHYVPAISHHIWEMNKEAAEDAKIPLKGLAIGNGLTNTEIQYTAYPDMALDGGKSEGGSLKEGVITNQYGNFYIINTQGQLCNVEFPF